MWDEIIKAYQDNPEMPKEYCLKVHKDDTLTLWDDTVSNRQWVKEWRPEQVYAGEVVEYLNTFVMYPADIVNIYVKED